VIFSSHPYSVFVARREQALCVLLQSQRGAWHALHTPEVYVCACRRESNRESARRSRMRKIEEIEHLGGRLREVQRAVDASAAELTGARGEHARAAKRLRGLQRHQAAAVQQARAGLA
jgi:bZIP transcription factor